MKIRNSFVSNSSSASFIIYKSKLNTAQRTQLRDWYFDYIENRKELYQESDTQYNWDTFKHLFELSYIDDKSNTIVGYVSQLGFSPDFDRYPELKVLFSEPDYCCENPDVVNIRQRD